MNPSFGGGGGNSTPHSHYPHKATTGGGGNNTQNNGADNRERSHTDPAHMNFKYSFDANQSITAADMGDATLPYKFFKLIHSNKK